MPRRSLPRTVALPPEIENVQWRDRLLFAFYYTVAAVLLGIVVSPRPPYAIDLAGRYFAGHGLLVAEALTFLGTFPVYAAISVLILIVGLVKREWLRAVLVSILTLVAAWQTSDALKEIFHRARPAYWFVHREPSHSYPSGHATLVIAFYGFWSAVAWSSSLPQSSKRWIRLAFAAFAIALGWSRLALGAHYVTDVLGGYLLGGAFASVGLIVYRLLEPAEP